MAHNSKMKTVTYMSAWKLNDIVTNFPVSAGFAPDSTWTPLEDFRPQTSMGGIAPRSLGG